MPSAANLADLKRLRADAAALGASASGPAWPQYERDPAGYCRDVLKVRLTPDQERIAGLLLVPPYKVLVQSAHNVGKSFLAACLVLWWYDTRRPSICLTTAPVERQVHILWAAARLLRGRQGGFAGPKVPRLEDAPDHWAAGFTARDGTRFQGHHSDHVMVVFDEAVGVDRIFWEAAQTMLGGRSYCMLAPFNPTDQTSPAYEAVRSGGYHVVTMSAVDHPNVTHGLAGNLPPIPSAITLPRLTELLREWSTILSPEDDPEPGDVELQGVRYRPGPVAEARLLGRWPSKAVNAVWSEALWQHCERTRHELRPDWPVRIGCDVARFGDDLTTIHIRCGMCSIHHEAHNGWDTTQTAGRLKQLTHEHAPAGVDPRAVPCLVDVGGPGVGVIDQANGYCFVPVNSSETALSEDRYHNVRSELWFVAAQLAKAGCIDVTRLTPQARSALSQQLPAPTYTLDAAGRMRVEPKADTKKRLGCSPDHADALNLAYYPYSG